jgi:hypothetical protein
MNITITEVTTSPVLADTPQKMVSGETLEGVPFTVWLPARYTDTQCASHVKSSEFASNPTSCPAYVEMGQARCVLALSGQLAAVQALMAQLPEGHFTRIMWEFSPRIARYSAYMTQMQAALGWTDLQIDALFIAANAVV